MSQKFYVRSGQVKGAGSYLPMATPNVGRAVPLEKWGPTRDGAWSTYDLSRAREFASAQSFHARVVCYAGRDVSSWVAAGSYPKSVGRDGYIDGPLKHPLLSTHPDGDGPVVQIEYLETNRFKPSERRCVREWGRLIHHDWETKTACFTPAASQVEMAATCIALALGPALSRHRRRAKTVTGVISIQEWHPTRPITLDVVERMQKMSTMLRAPKRLVLREEPVSSTRSPFPGRKAGPFESLLDDRKVPK